jgi:hypothetical protein
LIGVYSLSNRFELCLKRRSYHASFLRVRRVDLTVDDAIDLSYEIG